MFTLLTVPGVRTWRDRAAARARYRDLSVTLDDLVDDLYVLDDHDERAATLDLAAEVTAELAESHTAAWGLDPDRAGRPMRVSLIGQAVLLRRVAATERAVVLAACPDPSGLDLDGDPDFGSGLGGACGDAAELGTWARLAHTADPAERADCLRSLHELVGRSLGERAAVVLAVLADIDEHRAARRHACPAAPNPAGLTPPRWYRWGRVLIAAVFALAAAAVVVPGVDDAVRLAVLLGVPAGVYAALAVFSAVRARGAGREAGA